MQVLRCQTLGLHCGHAARGKDEQEVMGKAAEHAKKNHGMDRIPDEVAAKDRAIVHRNC